MAHRYLIDSLPRSGSTSLAKLLNCHPNAPCLIEPFHPRRYDGQYYRMALGAGSLELALSMIWHRWSGIKHVWTPVELWPFSNMPSLNEEIVRRVDRVIFIERRNLLKRYVSSAICRQLDFWIGTRHELLARLANCQLRPLDFEAARNEIHKSRSAIEGRIAFLRESGVPTLHLFYEDFYSENATQRTKQSNLNDVLQFLGYEAVDTTTFEQKYAAYFDSDTFQWASREVYDQIPDIDRFEDAFGSDSTGWLS